MKTTTRKSISIKDLIAQVNSGDFVLPEIQREFVWDLNRIAELWDSIYHGYPIGQLLFWQTNTKISAYSFFDSNTKNTPYLFVGGRPRWYHNTAVEITNKTIVLDGQQRLTSLFLGASDQGVFVKKRTNSPAPEIPHKLCIYIGKEDPDADNEIKLFDWQDQPNKDYLPVCEALSSKYAKNQRISTLKKRLSSLENAVSVDYLRDGNLVDVIEIFRRLNNNGRNMTKSELFLAMLFGNKQTKGLKNSLDGLRQAYGKNFDVKDSTITQLLISTFDSVSNRSSANYSEDMFKNIASELPKLKTAAKACKNFLENDCGIYSNSEMISHSLFIPLTYAFYKRPQPSEHLHAELRCFTYRALIMGLFSSRTNATIPSLKKAIDKIVADNSDDFINAIEDAFVLNTCFKDTLAGGKNTWIVESVIPQLLREEKGVRAKLILLLLRPEKADVDGENYDQDHIMAYDLFHPYDNIDPYRENVKFGMKNYDGPGKPTDEELERWAKIRENYKPSHPERADFNRNALPNLWLLESSRNRQKSKKILSIWYAEQDTKYQEEFWQETFLPKPKTLSSQLDYLKIDNFDQLYAKRKEILRKQLKELLKLPK